MGKTIKNGLAIIVAMECEAESVLSSLGGAEEAEIGGRKVFFSSGGTSPRAVVVSGIGKTRAASATEFAILALGAKSVLNAGLCGGFGGNVEIGGVYEVDKAAEYDFDLSAFNGGRIAVKDGRQSPFVKLSTEGIFPARSLATGDRFTDADDDHDFISNTLGCSLRDMEGAAVAFTCETAGVECRALKCVSDVADARSMTGQYLENKRKCLDSLSRAVAPFLDRIGL